MINVLIATESATKFKDNYEIDFDPEFPDDENKKKPKREDMTKEVKDSFKLHLKQQWIDAKIGGKDYQVLSLYVSEETVSEVSQELADIQTFKDNFPGETIVLGAWYAEAGPGRITAEGKAVEYGQTVIPATYDEEGVELTPETIEGDHVYHPDENGKLFVPDDVEYNEDGSEKKRTKATKLRQMIGFMGQPLWNI